MNISEFGLVKRSPRPIKESMPYWHWSRKLRPHEIGLPICGALNLNVNNPRTVPDQTTRSTYRWSYRAGPNRQLSPMHGI
jgi:hypothetical protein